MLHHASLEILRAQADVEVAFWVLLGFAEVKPPAPELAARSRWLQEPGSRTQIHLVYEDQPTIPHRGHVAVVCPAHAATLTALRAAGFEVVEREHYWDSPRAFVHSPAGHRVEVMAFPPPA